MKATLQIIKIILPILLTALLTTISLQTYAQGTLTFDQQSATGPVSPFDNFVDGLNIQEDTPLLQSFVPTLTMIGFVQLEFQDVPNNGNNGATVYVNLWTGSPNIQSATLLGSTIPVFMPNGFVNNGLGLAGVANFNFSTSITLTPGQTYYLEPVVQSGDDPWDVLTIGDTYPNGQLFGKTGGFFQPGTDFWFREGATVPEPAPLALAGLSGILLIVNRRFRRFLLVAGFSIPTLIHADTYYLQSYGGVGSLPLPMNPYGNYGYR